ncbi:MAG: hypothetical protein COB02_14625 [Candidatus Cloacimonadota bacterium]|nr:MAG: hypothetical protein COB02_14625 [Candidatus Cloacimonadota bacterium]
MINTWKTFLLFYIFLQSSSLFCVEKPSPTRGKILFKTQYFNGKRVNSCKNCHNLTENHFTKILKAGPPLKNSYYRESFSKKKYRSITSAIEACMRVFQQKVNKNNQKDLESYLKLISTPKLTQAYSYKEIPSHLPKNISGSSFEGRGTYITSCLPCHDFHSLDLTKLPLAKETLYKKVRGMSPLFRREKIQLTQTIYNDNFDKIKMPIFSRDRLSDESLINIITYMMETIRTRP